MRNLVAFLVRYNSFFIFLFFQLLAFTLIVRFNEFHENRYINSSNALTASVYNGFSETFQYLHLKEVNDSLMLENARLRRKMVESIRNKQSAVDTFTDSSMLQVFTYNEAQVINNSTHKLQNFLTLDRGRTSGIREGMGVISHNGVVGVVTAVSENFSSVMSLLNHDSHISARLRKQNYPGIVQWNGRDPQVAQLNDIPKHVNLEQGDDVMTSGYSSIFPTNIPIGNVIAVNENSGDNFLQIEIDLATDFGRLRYVYVVQNNLKVERNHVENQEQ